MGLIDASKEFPAGFPGECGTCGFAIDEGDPIRMGDGQPHHTDCIAEEMDREREEGRKKRAALLEGAKGPTRREGRVRSKRAAVSDADGTADRPPERESRPVAPRADPAAGPGPRVGVRPGATGPADVGRVADLDGHDGPILVRHSEISDFRQCPLKHKLNWRDLWAPADETAAQTLGTAWHKVMAVHYLGIRHFQRANGSQLGFRHLKLTRAQQQAVIDDVESLIVAELNPEHEETLYWMYDGYVDRWGFDDGWEILEAERTLSIPFVEEDGTDSVFHYRWTGDLLVRDHTVREKHIWSIDHKSTSQKLRQIDIDLDDQFGLYMWAWRRFGYNVMAPVINQALTKQLKRAQTLEERFNRDFSYRTETELKNIAQEALDVAWRIHDPANLRRPISAPDPRTCSWKCPFKEAHILLRKSKNPARELPSLMHSRGYVQREEVPSGSA